MTHPMYLPRAKHEEVVATWGLLQNVRQVSKRTGVACSTIYNILERHGVAPRDKGPKLGAEMEARLHAIFASAKWTDGEIGRMLGWCRRRVRYHRDRLGYGVVYGCREERGYMAEPVDAEAVLARRRKRLEAPEDRWGEALAGRRFVSAKAAPVGRMSCVPFPHVPVKSSADF